MIGNMQGICPKLYLRQDHLWEDVQGYLRDCGYTGKIVGVVRKDGNCDYSKPGIYSVTYFLEELGFTCDYEIEVKES